MIEKHEVVFCELIEFDDVIHITTLRTFRDVRPEASVSPPNVSETLRPEISEAAVRIAALLATKIDTPVRADHANEKSVEAHRRYQVDVL